MGFAMSATNELARRGRRVCRHVCLYYIRTWLCVCEWRPFLRLCFGFALSKSVGIAKFVVWKPLATPLICICRE